MTFQGLPLWLFGPMALVGFAIIVVLYLIRWKVPQRVVSTTQLWLSAMVRRRGDSGRVGPVQQWPSLVLQLLIFALLTLALSQPRLACQGKSGRSVVLVFDRSSSMATTERVEPRIETAKRRAVARLASLAATDEVGVVLAGGAPEIAAPLGRDPARVRTAMTKAKIRSGSGRLAEATENACALLSHASDPLLIVITDGSEPTGSCTSAPVEVIRVGSARSNVGITRFAASRMPFDPAHFEAFAEIQNSSSSAVQADLRLDADGSLLRLVHLSLAPNEVVRRSFEGLPASKLGRIVGRLTDVRFADHSTDALGDDDTGYAVLEPRAQIRVDLVGDSRTVRLVLGANPRYAVTSRSSLGESSGAVTVVVGPVAAPLKPGRYLFINPSGPGFPVGLSGRLTQPRITDWREEHPILRQVVLTDVLIAEASSVGLPPTATPLFGTSRSALAFALADGPLRVVALTFDLESSNLPLRVGFPVFMYNAIDWLLDDVSAGASSDTTLLTTRPLEVRAPDGSSRKLSPVEGRVEIETGAAGFYEVHAEDGSLVKTLAMSVTSADETSISPTADAQKSAKPAGGLRDREVAGWFILCALCLLLIEWNLFHRQVTR